MLELLSSQEYTSNTMKNFSLAARENIVETWLQRDDESREEYVMFRKFLQEKPPRDLYDVYQKLLQEFPGFIRNLTIDFGELAHKNKWFMRANDYDRLFVEEQRDAVRLYTAKQRGDRTKIMDAIIDKINDQLVSSDFSEASPLDLVKMAEAVQKMMVLEHKLAQLESMNSDNDADDPVIKNQINTINAIVADPNKLAEVVGILQSSGAFSGNDATDNKLLNEVDDDDDDN